MKMQQSKSEPRFYKAVDGAKYLFLALLASLFLVQLVLSLGWPLEFDTSFMHYIAYLINEHGFAPYRDIFEINMPGTYLFHMAVGKMFGYSDLAFRMVDVAWLTATLTVTWFVMRPAGRITALASCLLFSLIYLEAGPKMSLERDFIAILPMATAVLLATRHSPWRSVNLTNFLVGALFALAALIKPHMAIGLPAMVVYNSIYCIDGSRSAKTFIKTCTIGSLFALLGFLSTLAIPFIWLWRIGAISSFWDILSSFTPLYSQLAGNMEVMGTISGFIYNLKLYIWFGGFRLLFLGSMFGVYHIWAEHSPPATKKLALLLFSLTILYSISVAIGGKFWLYHWMPYTYFASLCTALMLFSTPSFEGLRFPRIFFPLFIFVFIIVLTVRPSSVAFKQLLKGPPFSVQSGRVGVYEIAAYLNENLLPTDKVQPLDWGGGSLHAMLISKAVLATPYITDFQFYLHVSTPYIQKLRKHFIEELEQDIPAFIIDVHKKPRLSGIDTDYSFPALERFIKQHYSKDYTGNGFEILRRNDKS
ncbi:hypothetical protein [Moorena sp. SIO4G3]|uniref:hypothetical protein n=1 Tax=Moorena sp. SIO4G3 TaxID=2607821 RepID=UPI00142B7826|nr:hypothetical protein [Moorena sp. SIO4G3]NEO77630.1 hypothetical protein [Moorena sp. SIO4G3]